MHLTKQPTEKSYIEGFLTGQMVAYCEQVKLGSRLAGAINCDQSYVDKLISVAVQEDCRIEIVPTSPGRVCFWVYKYEFLKSIIGHLQSIPNGNIESDFGIWAMGKLFGYADCEIARFIDEKLNPVPK